MRDALSHAQYCFVRGTCDGLSEASLKWLHKCRGQWRVADDDSVAGIMKFYPLLMKHGAEEAGAAARYLQSLFL